MATWAATVSFAPGSLGRRDLVASGERAVYATLAMAVLASARFWTALFSYAFAIAELLTRKLDAEWLAAVRKWALLAWFFNTTGILLGMWWAYVELGWGGYWAWDPVENASLLPWLVNTAFLHSIMVQEKRGMLRKWNVTLVVTTSLLAIFGTFITRSGVISSVHSFAQSPVGKWFDGFLILAIAVTAYLVSTRLHALRSNAELD